MNLESQIESAEIKQRGTIALEKAKKLENKNMRKGYRYFKINERTKILIECDKKGEPTEQGQRVLDAIRNTIGK